MFYVNVTELGSVGIELATDIQAYRYFLNPGFMGLQNTNVQRKNSKVDFRRLLTFSTRYSKSQQVEIKSIVPLNLYRRLFHFHSQHEKCPGT